MGGQPPAPAATRQHQHDRGEAEQLHQQVGADRAGDAEQIAHRPSVAWLSEGSCTDQVASAMAASSASVISAMPPISLRRRRRMSRKCSETKATASRLRSIAACRVYL